MPNPVVLDFVEGYGVRTNRFGFRISWATDASVVIDACTGLSTGTWSPLKTNTLLNGWTYFSDPDWTNHPARFYRIRSP